MASGWDELERWMDGQRLPKGFGTLLDQPDWIEGYVRKMMTRALPAAASVLSGSRADIKETKNFVIVAYPLGEGADIGRLRLVAFEDRIKLYGVKGGKAEIVKLPKLVKPRTCEARYDGSMLKIRLRKRPPSKRSFEAAIIEGE